MNKNIIYCSLAVILSSCGNCKKDSSELSDLLEESRNLEYISIETNNPDSVERFAKKLDVFLDNNKSLQGDSDINKIIHNIDLAQGKILATDSIAEDHLIW